MITAWLGSEEIKSRTIALMEQHRELDALVQGSYWDGGKGCHLGCLTHSENDAHDAASRLFGLPLRVCYWLESIFEGLPLGWAAWWAVESLRAIPVGADLSLAHHHFGAWLLGPESPIAEGNAHPLVADVVVAVRLLHERVARGEEVPENAWASARFDAWASVGASAKAAARSDAWSSVWAAARSAESAAESACAAECATARSAESAARASVRFAACAPAWSAAETATWTAPWTAWTSARSAVRSAAWAAETARSAAWDSIAAKTIEIFAASRVATCDACDQQREATLIHLAAIDLTLPPLEPSGSTEGIRGEPL